MDELAEINGIKPNVFLADGEEHEVGSATRYVSSAAVFLRTIQVFSSKSKYNVKRTLDHYHWRVMTQLRKYLTSY